VADGRVTGPGVFDMLAGIVQALHGLSELDDLSGVELLFSSDEEVGSLESRDLIEERARACGAVLVLEPSADGER
jgi:glutamate carboxypeptidase